MFLRTERLEQAKKELVEESNSSDKKLKSTASPAPKFRKKGVEKQDKVNSQVLDHVQSASSYLAATPGSSGRELKELERKVAYRNKPAILFADSADDGWEEVSEYQRRNLAGNSDDDKRLRQAETLCCSETKARPISEEEILLDLRMILSTLFRFLDFNP
ncbi:hypothetical protein P5673_001610 [Acropora cervicornis]|uniref:Uncharacterized protein n=1 Tax=Acropora cervicornis TaxID=6130 RepID=A0AAD9R416_ACRCE|nr:hypothetical protein P5673_001610 [Acropora cervicornis]